jgi:alpha-N-arabinofuranosidase
VRNNHISHCEQAGIVGSLGPIFCTVTGNVIHDIHVRQLFSGAEMAGIKFHGAIDTEISHNHIYRTNRGIWLDWMAQGTHVTGNLFHDNGPAEDLMVEVNHGPFLVDNNIFLSPVCLFDMSEGGAYVHNLYAGRLGLHPEMGRETPFHKAHSTEVAGLHKTPGGDSRFYNNIFVSPAGLDSYDKATLPMQLGGNVFVKGAASCKAEQSPLMLAEFDPELKLVQEKDGVYLHVRLDKSWADKQQHPLVTTQLLGKAKIPDLPYEHPDGSPYRIATDYFDNARNAANPFPGPFELPDGGEQVFKLWPISVPR